MRNPFPKVIYVSFLEGSSSPSLKLTTDQGPRKSMVGSDEIPFGARPMLSGAVQVRLVHTKVKEKDEFGS